MSAATGRLPKEGRRQDKRTDGRRGIFFNNFNKKHTSTGAKHDGIVPYTVSRTDAHRLGISISSRHYRNNPKFEIGRA
jgi:uncharacterized protein YqjF (DUF2071 family)